MLCILPLARYGLPYFCPFMHYAHLFSPQRTGGGLSEGDQDTARHLYQRDFDRLIFSSAFRRMQNKTQVFPLPEAAVFVHNRLTHSLEVASVGRSLGNMVGNHVAKTAGLADDDADFYRHQLGAVISAACLAHDIGNPPFGHSGERAISGFFEKNPGFLADISPSLRQDFTAFEGNANGFRILTFGFKGRQQGGLRLTQATLAATLKYPCASQAMLGKKGPLSRKKYGFFDSCRPAFAQVFEKTGMQYHPGQTGEACLRHPFTFLTEAADDICYRIIDLEDGHRLGIVPFDQIEYMLRGLIEHMAEPGALSKMDANLTVLKEGGDNNEVVGYYRARVINALISATVEVYIKNEQAILSGSLESSLLDSIGGHGQKVLDDIDTYSVKNLYQHRSVVEIEIAGYKILGGLLEEFVPALLSAKPTDYERRVKALIPSQFLPDEGSTPYQQVQAAVDFVSGMTDNFALALYRKLMGIDW